MRKVNVNDVAEFSWPSPKGNFAGAGKNLSEELGRDPSGWSVRPSADCCAASRSIILTARSRPDSQAQPALECGASAQKLAAPTFFKTPAAFRAWLEQHHASETELWVGFHRKATGRPSIAWPESVDEALCVGWIDGLRKTVDESSYMIRFTPRKATSSWSLVNIGRVAELTRAGRMRPPGFKAFAERVEAKSGIYAYEQRKNAALNAEAEKEFRRNAAAWAFFQAQSASYRKVAAWWVISAKQEATRRKRVARLIADSEAGKRLQ